MLEWLQQLHERTGLNFSVFYDRFDRVTYLRGLLETVELSACVILGSLVVGVLCAGLQRSGWAPVRWLTGGYVALFRNTPQLAQLYFFYFGLGALMPRVLGPDGTARTVIDAFWWCVIAFSITGGAFNGEILRGGIEAVPRPMAEASEALGYSRLRAYLFIILPLAFRISLPALNNSLITLVKGTTVGYAIGVRELLTATTTIMLAESNTFEMMTLLLITFLVIVSALVAIMHWLERQLHMPGYTR